MIYRVTISAGMVAWVLKNGARLPAVTVKGGLPDKAKLVQAEITRLQHGHVPGDLALIFECDNGSDEVVDVSPKYVQEAKE